VIWHPAFFRRRVGRRAGDGRVTPAALKSVHAVCTIVLGIVPPKLPAWVAPLAVCGSFNGYNSACPPPAGIDSASTQTACIFRCGPFSFVTKSAVGVLPALIGAVIAWVEVAGGDDGLC